MCNEPTCSDNAVVTAPPADSADRVFAVKGMTCQHCADSVTEEVEQVPGVTGVKVNLESGHVTVDGSGFSDDEIHTAVDEAGYEVVRA
jgi:copper chaperone CopZ